MSKFQNHKYIYAPVVPDQTAKPGHIAFDGPDGVVSTLCDLSVSEITKTVTTEEGEHYRGSLVKNYKPDRGVCPTCEQKYRQHLAQRHPLLRAWA